MLWFFLISLSPVLTYQHHVIDIVGGFVVAGYCFYFFREPSLPLPVVVNRRIGLYYAAGAAVALLMGAIFWPWGVLLLWPTVALGIVAIAYFGAGPIVFHKTRGTLPWSTRRWANSSAITPETAPFMFTVRSVTREVRPRSPPI